MFPAPLEVDRCLYNVLVYCGNTVMKFPSPFEVDRYLYDGNADFEYFPSMFPAPREVGIYTEFTIEPDGLITTK